MFERAAAAAACVALGMALVAPPAAATEVPSPSELVAPLDADRDGVPDALEAVCAVRNVQLTVNQLTFPQALCELWAQTVPDPVPVLADGDRDGVPDEAEGQLCGRAAVANAVNAASPTGGRCETPGDYRPPVPLDADGDDDRVPDAAEPFVCSVEDRNTPDDGTCAGGDYSPPRPA